MLVVAVAATSILLCPVLPWPVQLILGVLLGNVYGSLFFFGHHLLHGAMIKRQWVQDILMFPCTAIFGLSPHLWRVWHHRAHHPHTNVPGHDPDNFGTLSAYTGTLYERILLSIAPGNGQWFRGLLYLSTFFVLQAQGVLWIKSRPQPCFKGLNRPRAAFETALIAAFWCGLGYLAGPRSSLFAIVVPWLVANFIALSYIVTQHLLRPSGVGCSTFENTMSLSVPRFIDRIHWFNSHHVEHHLFPVLPYSALPAVRRAILRRFEGSYLAPGYGRALLSVLMTPRLYDGDALVDPKTGRRVPFAEIEAVLRGCHSPWTLHPRHQTRGSTSSCKGS